MLPERKYIQGQVVDCIIDIDAIFSISDRAYFLTIIIYVRCEQMICFG